MVRPPCSGDLRLVLPGELPGKLVVEVGPTIGLPGDIQAWIAHTLAELIVIDLLETTTTAGWPVTIVATRTFAQGDARRTVFAFYELFDRATVVAVIAPDGASLDGERAAIHGFLRAADVDRAPRAVVARAQLWEQS